MNKLNRHTKILKTFRKIHKITGAILFVVFFIVSISGLLLGWKKNSGGIIQAKFHKGISTDLSKWLSIDSLQTIAFNTLKDSIDESIDLDLQRIDARPRKGMVKFVFDNHFWGIQLDGTTGKVLAITRRNSDIIEKIHDGSILDFIFDTKGETIKLIYTTIIGTSLLMFTITGFWLWYGPKYMRKINKKTSI